MVLSQKYNYYEILEIHVSSPPHEVSNAYKRAKETYSGSDPAIYTIFTPNEARELMKMIEEAYAVLGNRQLRMLYDKKITSEFLVNEEELSKEALLQESQNLPRDLKLASSKPAFQANPELERLFQQRSEWDGEHLRQVREYKMLSLKELHDITKINPFYISALENMLRNELPAEVFVRGYVRQVSKALGLNEKTVADSYMAKFREIPEVTREK